MQTFAMQTYHPKSESTLKGIIDNNYPNGFPKLCSLGRDEHLFSFTGQKRLGYCLYFHALNKDREVLVIKNIDDEHSLVKLLHIQQSEDSSQLFIFVSIWKEQHLLWLKETVSLQ